MELYIGLAVVVAIVVWVIATYNGLVGKRNEARNAWSQIDVQLKRRHDLIPNLVNTVRGYMQHEREVLENVTSARAAAIAAGPNVAERATTENALSQSLRSLFAVSEAYPDLKANTNMLALQEELASTENRIAFSRQHYNDSVTGYDNALQSFPSNLIARNFGFAPLELFELEDPTERDVPQVQF